MGDSEGWILMLFPASRINLSLKPNLVFLQLFEQSTHLASASLGLLSVTCNAGSQWIEHQTQMYHLLGGWLCEPAHGGHSDQGDCRQNHGEVQVVDILHHRWALIWLIAPRLHINKVQDQPNKA